MDFKTDKIEEFASTVVGSREHKKEIEYLCQKLNLTKSGVINAWITWDTGINNYGNDIYGSLELRLAMHLHNYLPGSWHIERQKKIIEFLDKIKPVNICEIGFGVPQNYIKEYVFKNSNVHLDLLDFDKEAIVFADALLGFWHKDYTKQISTKLYDLNSSQYPGDYDAYMFQDSIEHANSPTEYLSSLVSNIKKGTYFLFSLPIEVDKPVPEHFIFWKDDKGVFRWLEDSGLKVIKYSKISMNKDVDIFAEFLHKDFYEIIILAQK
ncbi:MAG: hypothetical protein WC835_01865 [Candidatus Paceibacterota bacterium]|jgi:hypothetical protein